MAEHQEFLDHIADRGLPVPLHPAVAEAYRQTSGTVPVQFDRVLLILPPEAGICRIDGIDGDPEKHPEHLCSARTAHDAGFVTRYRAAREAHDLTDPASVGEMQQLELQRLEINRQQGHSHCVHCGTVVGPNSHLARHAAAGFEDTGLRLDVLHCDGCYQTDACSPNRTTPGSGFPGGAPGGFCIFPEPSTTLAAEVFPGAGLLWRFLRWGGALAVAYIAAHLLIHSQGQQAAFIQGTANQAVCQQDSTSGHGYNLGTISFYTGAATGNGNSAPTGTDLCDVALPNPLFGAATGHPSVCTANAITAATILSTNTVGYGRMTTNASTGVPTPEDNLLSTTERRLEFSVATSAADCIVNTTAFVSGGSLTVTSMTYQAPS